MDWKSVVATVAPWIGTALTGPFGGMAVSAVADAFGLSDKTESTIKQALSGATPDQMLALKKADQDFALQMQAMGFKQISDLESLAVKDRGDARDMQKLTRSNMPAVLTCLITFGFFGVLGWMLYDDSVVNSPPLLIMLGSLGTAWTGCCAFWFGTTQGSQNKDQLLANSTPAKA